MEVMYLLIAFSLLIASGFLLAFMWAVRSGQYDDRYTPSVRILLDDIRPVKKDADAAGSTMQAGINKSSTSKENEKRSRTGPMDASRKAGFNSKRGGNQRGGSPAAGIRSQEHHPKPKTRR